MVVATLGRLHQSRRQRPSVMVHTSSLPSHGPRCIPTSHLFTSTRPRDAAVVVQISLVPGPGCLRPGARGSPRCGCQDPTPATPARLIEIAVGSNFGILNEFKWKRSQQQNCKNQQYLQLLFWLTFHLLNFEWFKFGIFKFWRLQTSFQNPKWSQTKNYEYPKFWQLQTSQILNFKRMTPSH
jgi:hypothetical protein